MSSLLDRLKQAKNKLNNVQTRVTSESGDQICVKRDEDGAFVPVDTICADVCDEEEVEAETSDAKPSKRRQKIVERWLRYGYVVDLKPDLQMGDVGGGLFIGSQDVAADIRILKGVGITHVINAATSVQNYFPKHFEYLSLRVLDMPTQNLRCYFDTSNDFIRQAIEGGGKVFVHCNAGISRSSTLVVAYIMSTERKSLDDALNQVRIARPVVRPNAGFMQQLRAYATELGVE